jgi:small conductance mechanosensitive channel
LADSVEHLFSETVAQIDPQFVLEVLQKAAIFGVILLITFILSRILGISISRALGRTSPNVTKQVRRFVSWFVWLLGILVGLNQVGLDLTILLVIVALTGVMLLLATRDILASVASHEAISAYNPFKVGDWIQVGKAFGRVIDITYMDTILMTPDNETVYIPNSRITQSIVINRTTPGGIRISVPLVIDKDMDLSDVEKNLIEIGNELSEELAPDTKPEVRVTSINERSVRLALLLGINNPAKGKLISSEVRKRAKERLDKLRRKK